MEWLCSCEDCILDDCSATLKYEYESFFPRDRWNEWERRYFPATVCLGVFLGNRNFDRLWPLSARVEGYPAERSEEGGGARARLDRKTPRSVASSSAAAASASAVAVASASRLTVVSRYLTRFACGARTCPCLLRADLVPRNNTRDTTHHIIVLPPHCELSS